MDIARSTRSLRVSHDGPLPALTHNEVIALLELIPEDDSLCAARDRALVALLYGTACRCISIERADIGHLDAAGATLRHAPKGHLAADAQVALPPAVCALVAVYLAQREQELGKAGADAPLFIALDRRSAGRRLTTRSMRRIVLRLMELGGHARRDGEGDPVNPGVYSAHSLRRSALVTAAESEGLEAAQSLAGHQRIETTRRAYVRAKMHDKLRRVAGALDLVKRPAKGTTP